MTEYNWFPRTKVQIPMWQTVVERPAIVAALRQTVLSKRLTLLSAPTGAGKSTVAAMMARQTPTLRLAWLSLDAEDNDPNTFLVALITALQTVVPQVGNWVLHALQTAPVGVQDVVRYMGGVVNELLETDESPLVLVLDDLHLMTEPRVTTALDFLLERLPAHVHLLATTRYDPALALARLRARGELGEFRLKSLQFSAEETHHFLNEQLELGLTTAELEQVQGYSEGWVAGLRLLALSLAPLAPSERHGFLQQVAQREQNIFELLAEEVLAHQSPENRRFLLETSILKALTPSLCRAVTQEANAGESLLQIYRRNLFLIRVESDDPTSELAYRYHALFQAFLQERLRAETPDLIPQLHQRAAAHQPTPQQALYHYAQAQAWQEAATLIEAEGWRLFWQGRHALLREWLSWLPESIRRQRPWIRLLEGYAIYQRGDWHHGYQMMNQALQQFQAQGNKQGEWETIVMLLGIADVIGQLAPDATRAEAERLLTEPIPPLTRARILIGLAWWHMTFSEDWNEINRVAEAIIALCRLHRDGEIHGAIVADFSCYFWFIPNGRARLVAFHREFQSLYDAADNSHALWLRLTLADNDFWAGRIAVAHQQGVAIQQKLERMGGVYNLETNVLRLLIWVALAEADNVSYERIRNQLHLLHRLPEGHATYHTQLAVAAYGAWLQQDGALLRQLRQQSREALASAVPVDMTSGFGSEIIEAFGLLYERDPRAESLLRTLVKQQQTRRDNLALLADMRVPLAHFYLGQKQRDTAMAVVEDLFLYYEQLNAPGLLLKHGDALPPLLELALSSRQHRSFAETIKQLWETLREVRAVALPDGGEKLTPREVEVLRLLAKGASNREVAETLIVAERTVKAHVTNIMSKLGVSSRGQAVARAREWRLL